MDDSSEDDRPIGTRDIVKAATRLLEDDDSDVTGSPVPEWISQHTPVEKSRPEAESSSDSDEVVDLISQDPKDALHEDKTGFSGPLADNAKRKPSPPAALNKTKNSKGPAVAKKGNKGNHVKPPTLPPAGLSQATMQVPAIPEAAATGGIIPIVMPEKLAKGRFLVELEATEGGAADLAGDAGAVGRFSLSGSSSNKESMLLDLKGCIYSASMVPCATTLCVVNLHQTEAKVEALFDSFMSLREESNCNGRSDEGNNLFMFDDDDNYQIDEDGDRVKKPTGKRKAGQDQDGGAAPKKKKAAVKAKGGKGAAGKPKAVKKKAAARGATSKK